MARLLDETAQSELDRLAHSLRATILTASVVSPQFIQSYSHRQLYVAGYELDVASVRVIGDPGVLGIVQVMASGQLERGMAIDVIQRPQFVAYGCGERASTDYLMNSLWPEKMPAPSASPIEISSRFVEAETRHLDCGRTRYPLRSALNPQQVLRLSEALTGKASQLDDEVKRRFHFSFQRLYRTLLEDKSDADRRLWTLLSEMVDLDEFERLYPLPEPAVCEVLSVDEKEVRLVSENGDTERFDPRDLDSVGSKLLAAQPGMMVYGEIRRYADGRIEWLTCRLSEALLTDQEVWQKQGDTIQSLDGLPEAPWPRRAKEDSA